MAENPKKTRPSHNPEKLAQQQQQAAAAPEVEPISEVLPKTGLVYSEKSTMVEVLCKPKLMAIKSSSLIRLEELEKQAIANLNSGGRIGTAMTTVAPQSSSGRPAAAKRL